MWRVSQGRVDEDEKEYMCVRHIMKKKMIDKP